MSILLKTLMAMIANSFRTKRIPGDNICTNDTLCCLCCALFIVTVVFSHRGNPAPVMYLMQRNDAETSTEVHSTQLPFTIVSGILSANVEKCLRVSVTTPFPYVFFIRFYSPRLKYSSDHGRILPPVPLRLYAQRILFI